MKILLQTHKRPNHQLEHEYKKFMEAGCEVIPYGYYRKNTNELVITGLEDLDPSEQYLNRCSIQIVKHLSENKLFGGKYPSDFINSISYNAIAFEIDSIPESKYMLNKTPSKYIMARLNDIADMIHKHDIFVKPTNDLKSFTGTFVKQGKSLREALEDKKENIDLTQDFYVLVSLRCPRIIEEVRCFVVDHSVVTCGRYARNGVPDITHFKNDEESIYKSFAQEYIDIVYFPSNSFTIDLCKTDEDELLVVEYNCFNCSGLYNVDTTKLIKALQG